MTVCGTCPFYQGAILVTIGGFLLARNFGYDVPFWNALAVHRPVLILAWHSVKFIDYFRFRTLWILRLGCFQAVKSRCCCS